MDDLLEGSDGRASGQSYRRCSSADTVIDEGEGGGATEGVRGEKEGRGGVEGGAEGKGGGVGGEEGEKGADSVADEGKGGRAGGERRAGAAGGEDVFDAADRDADRVKCGPHRVSFFVVVVFVVVVVMVVVVLAAGVVGVAVLLVSRFVYLSWSFSFLPKVVVIVVVVVVVATVVGICDFLSSHWLLSLPLLWQIRSNMSIRRSNLQHLS